MNSATHHYIAAIRKELPDLPPWFHVEHKPSTFSDISLTMQHGLSGCRDHYTLDRIDTARLIIALTDALQESLKAEQGKVEA